MFTGIVEETGTVEQIKPAAKSIQLTVRTGICGRGLKLGASLAMCGAGFGFFQTPNNRAMLGAAPKARSGGAGGLQATARLLGHTNGTTIMALCFQLAGLGGPKLALSFGMVFAVLAAGFSLSRRKLR